MERQEFCGLFFTTHDRDECDGFDIEIDNPSAETVSVTVDISGSENVVISDAQKSHHVSKQSGTVANVLVPAKVSRGQIFVAVNVVRDDSEFSLGLKVIPGPKIDTIVEKCGIISYVRSLADLKGYEFSIDNPTSTNFTSVTVNFNPTGTSVLAAPGASASGNVVTYKGINAGQKGILVARLPTRKLGAPVGCDYKLEAVAAAAVSAQVLDTKTLSDKSVIKVIALPEDAGFEFQITNPGPEQRNFVVDFTGSKNLTVGALPPGVADGEFKISIQKVPAGTKDLVVARLTSNDPTLEDELAYEVESERWINPVPKARKAPVKAKTEEKSKTEVKSKSGLLGRPGRQEKQTLKCGIEITSTLLENLAGYTVEAVNPTANGFKLMLEFVKAENVDVVAEGSAVLKGPTSVMIEMPAGSSSAIAGLPSKALGKSIAMEYSAKTAALK